MPGYDTTYSPPAPILKVTISNPYNPGVRGIDNDAKIDSGADITAIPEDFVNALGLIPARKIPTEGYKKGEQTHYTYFVDVSFDVYSFSHIEVMAVKRKNVLIGRNILNQLKLILDGKNLNFDILDP